MLLLNLYAFMFSSSNYPCRQRYPEILGTLAYPSSIFIAHDPPNCYVLSTTYATIISTISIPHPHNTSLSASQISGFYMKEWIENDEPRRHSFETSSRGSATPRSGTSEAPFSWITSSRLVPSPHQCFRTSHASPAARQTKPTTPQTGPAISAVLWPDEEDALDVFRSAPKSRASPS